MSRDSTHVHGWSDLQQFGINALTGEADRYCQRILCDLNEEGAKLIRTWFSLPFDCPLEPPANHTVNGQPSVGHVLLDRHLMQPLATFALLHACDYDLVVLGPQGFATGLNADHEYAQAYLDQAERDPLQTIVRNCRKGSTAPGDGDRNTHLMSGRTR